MEGTVDVDGGMLCGSGIGEVKDRTAGVAITGADITSKSAIDGT